jgi:UDP-N-acetylglucosamine 4,6-dehydratase
MRFLDNASVLITGGTGSFGKALTKRLIESKARRIAIFSRDELKQLKMRENFENEDRLRWFLGDVRDLDRLKQAMYKVDFVIHAAALKQVPTGEFFPLEMVKTNILGSENVIKASIDSGVSSLVCLSTDCFQKHLYILLIQLHHQLHCPEN